MSHVVGRGYNTIKKTIGRLCGVDAAQRLSMQYQTRLHMRTCATTWEGWKVADGDIGHDKIPLLPRSGRWEIKT